MRRPHALTTRVDSSVAVQLVMKETDSHVQVVTLAFGFHLVCGLWHTFRNRSISGLQINILTLMLFDISDFVFKILFLIRKFI